MILGVGEARWEASMKPYQVADLVLPTKVEESLKNHPRAREDNVLMSLTVVSGNQPASESQTCQGPFVMRQDTCFPKNLLRE